MAEAKKHPYDQRIWAYVHAQLGQHARAELEKEIHNDFNIKQNLEDVYAFSSYLKRIMPYTLQSGEELITSILQAYEQS